ncbi:MAG: ribosome maturation factor RimP, partial [Epsilonproteobacteria bacterium]|nr:ribosome maturation factor RimP [Campylobacterota bacterium]
MGLREEIEKIVESYGAKVYDIESVEENGQKIYRVYIIKDDKAPNKGVDIDLCTNISYDISPLLDINPPINGEYNLEVSSPGIERKLTKPEHFKHSIGEKVKIKVLGGEKHKGELIDANEEGIEIKTKEGNKKFNYDELGTSKTYF